MHVEGGAGTSLGGCLALGVLVCTGSGWLAWCRRGLVGLGDVIWYWGVLVGTGELTLGGLVSTG